MQIRQCFELGAMVAALGMAVNAQVSTSARGSQRMQMSAMAVHNMLPEAAAGAIPIELNAVVTYYDPYIDTRHAAMFVHDSSGSVFVSLPSRPILSVKIGDRVIIDGVTGAGDFAPVVVGESLRVIGHNQMPTHGRAVTLSEMLSGVTDGQWREFEGRVRSVHSLANNVVMDVAASGGSVVAVTVRRPGANYEALIDSLVRIRGSVAPLFNQRRQMVGVHIFFASPDQVKVIESAPRDPFAVQIVPISQLFRYSPVVETSHRVHVRGRLTLDWAGRMICIQDDADGVCMATEQTSKAELGSLVDVVGFPAVKQLKPTIEDTNFRVVGPRKQTEPRLVTDGDALRAELDGQMIQLDAKLIGQDLAAEDPTLFLRAGTLLIPAVLPKDAASGAAPIWKDGSTVRVTGICNVQMDSLNTVEGEGAVRPQSMVILLRSVKDVAVIQAPSWWTRERALYGFAIVGAIVLAAFAWIIFLRLRVEQQTRALRGSEERLRHLSEHDALTGLPNRVLLNDRLAWAIKRTERFKSYLGVLMVDLDGFKEVNDALGHQAGDRLLCDLAGRLARSVRATDTVARIGGDEFVVLLPDLRIPAEAETIAAKITSAICRPCEIGGATATVTSSIGVVTFPDGGPAAEGLIECADLAMYEQKRRGKNGFRVYKPDSSNAGGTYAKPREAKPQFLSFQSVAMPKLFG